ncbi:MAG TPA: VWA domain-containing protein, partial [Thermoanaerobaculia bacterium]|nr:VWA domain-containing protein [Thermoanaerobaculia bacterium]
RDVRQRAQLYGSIRTLLHRIAAPGDLVQIVGWTYSLRALQPFTADLDKVDAVLKKLEAEPGFELDDKEMIQIERDHLMQAAALIGLPEILDVTPSAEDNVTHELNELKGKVRALEGMMTSISGVEGQKIVLLVTHRFSQVAGLEHVLIGSGAGPRPSRLSNTYDTSKELQHLTRVANASGVTIYPMFPEGLDNAATLNAELSHGTSPAAQSTRDYTLLQNETTALEFVAGQTGGVAAWGVQNVAELLPCIGDDLETYYSLAYRATASSQDKAKRIVVKLENPEYSVRARREIVNRSDDTLMRERAVSTLYAIPPDGHIPLRAELGTGRMKGKDRIVLPLKVRIPIGALTMLPQGGKHAGSFSVYVVWGSVFGDVSDVTKKTQPFTIDPADLERAKKSHFTYDLEIDASLRLDRIAIAVVDETSKEFGATRVDLAKK